MYSNNYIEIFLTATGWDFYGKVVGFIYTLNLHYLPFIAVMLTNWWETRQSQEAGIASIVEWRRNYIDIYSMMFVVILFWLPNQSTTFKPNDYVQEITGGDAANTVTYNRVESSFGGSAQNEIPLPPGWWVYLVGLKGSLNQIIDWTSLDSSPIKLLQGFSSTKIKDDALRQEVNAFFSSCYLTTLSRYRNESRQPYPTPAENDDINFIGNDLFMSTPGYYKVCSSGDSMCYGSAERMPYQTASTLGITTGYDPDTGTTTLPPSCQSWWTGEGYFSGILPVGGLYQKLVEEAKLNAGGDNIVEEWLINYQEMTDDMRDFYGVESTRAEREVALIKRLLRNDPPNFVNIPEKHGDEQGVWAQAADGIQKVIGAAGAAYESAWATVLVETLIPMLPMVQALVLLAVFVFMAFSLPLGLFSVETTIKHAFFIFGVMMWSLCWHLADLINDKLLTFLYPDTIALAEFSLDGVQQRAIIGMVSAATYILFPLILSAMIQLVGHSAADMLGDATRGAGKTTDKGLGSFGKGVGNVKN